MEQSIPLALSPAALFFVGQSDDAGPARHIPITPPFRIGRNPESDLSLPCRSVSGKHARIIEENGGLWLHDMDSTNGTFVNGQRVNCKLQLHDGDTVQFAATVFQVTGSKDRMNKPPVRRVPGGADPLTNLQDTQFYGLFTDGVVPFYQPIVDIDADEPSIAGYEVLGRSRLFGLETPKEMFAVASRLEMEVELSRVLRNQGIEVAANGLPDDLTLFVNTHPAELQCDGLVESLQEMRERCPTQPIALEIHESALNDKSQIVAIRSALRDLNIRLAFYDFGAGETSLVELSDVDPDILKFDIKLVRGIDKADTKRQQFVESLVKMVRDFGITPLAECIEEPGEHETLRQLGFKLGQGFFYGKPSSLPDCKQTIQFIAQTNKKSQAEPNDDPSSKYSRNKVPLVQSFLQTSGENESKQSVAVEDVAPNPDYNGAQWLMSQPSNFYTIQVLSAISQERAEQHIAKQQNPDEFASFRKQGKTRMLYMVVYGIFEDRAAAKAASEELAASGVSPWIRMLSSVHSEIRSTPQCT